MTDIKDLSLHMVSSRSSVAEAPVRDPALLHTVTAIFQRVLQCPPVQPDDDFFDLGGDSILVIALVAEIEAATGHSVPITAIFDAPTPAALTQLMLDATPSRQSSLVLLKPGRGGTPVFILHGVGGTVMELVDIGRSIDTDGPVYAVQARGLDGLDPPLDRIENMAACYLAEAKAIQPTGPYILLGSSFGGLVALEMARILVDGGERVALLGLLDSYPHPRFWSLRSRLGIMLNLAGSGRLGGVVSGVAGRYRAALMAMPAGRRLPYMLRRIRNALKLHRIVDTFDHFGSDTTQGTRRRRGGAAEPEVPAMIRRVRECGAIALTNYRPKHFAGTITFIKATDELRFPRDPVHVWNGLAARFQVHTLHCSHGQLLTTHSRQLGSTITAILQAIPSAG